MICHLYSRTILYFIRHCIYFRFSVFNPDLLLVFIFTIYLDISRESRPTLEEPSVLVLSLGQSIYQDQQTLSLSQQRVLCLSYIKDRRICKKIFQEYSTWFATSLITEIVEGTFLRLLSKHSVKNIVKSYFRMSYRRFTFPLFYIYVSKNYQTKLGLCLGSYGHYSLSRIEIMVRVQQSSLAGSVTSLLVLGNRLGLSFLIPLVNHYRLYPRPYASLPCPRNT